jgi:hypothetical protein
LTKLLFTVAVDAAFQVFGHLLQRVGVPKDCPYREPPALGQRSGDGRYLRWPQQLVTGSAHAFRAGPGSSS